MLPHKIIIRRNRIKTLRKGGGLSGFTRTESELIRLEQLTALPQFPH